MLARRSVLLSPFAAALHRRFDTIEDLPTPSMIVDLDAFERNLRRMADHSRSAGIAWRPHVKIHKSVDIARRQLALGAIGLTVATEAEAELMVGAGFKGVLQTRQPAGREKIARVAALARREPTYACVLDDPLTADLLDDAARVAGTKMNVLVDVFAGMTRAGCEPGDKALALAQRVDSKKNLHLAGLMGYSGIAAHTSGWEARKRKSAENLAGLLESARLCEKSGLPVPIRTGGSTGTYNIDVGSLTELQAGSFIFMDTGYRKIAGKVNPAVYDDFEPSLTVLTTVISRTHAGLATIDAGNKATLKPTDEVQGRPDMRVENQGAEYGMLVWKDGDRDLKLGDKVRLIPTNLDTSTNVFDRYYVLRGGNIVDIWPIMGRSGAAQR